MFIEIEKEVMSPHFTKYHIGEPINAVVHHFTSIAGENAHDHPFDFTSTILYGGYIERKYFVDALGYYWRDVKHDVDEVFHVKSYSVHEIIELPKGECYTIIKPGRKVKEPGFYRFEHNSIYYRQHNHSDWTKLL